MSIRAVIALTTTVTAAVFLAGVFWWPGPEILAALAAKGTAAGALMR